MNTSLHEINCRNLIEFSTEEISRFLVEFTKFRFKRKGYGRSNADQRELPKLVRAFADDFDIYPVARLALVCRDCGLRIRHAGATRMHYDPRGRTGF